MMMSTLGQNFDDGERLAVASESNQEVPPQEMKQCHSQCPLSSCCTGKWGRGGYSCFCCPVRSCAWTMCRYHCAFDCCCCCYCSSSTFCSSGAHYFRCIACERSDFGATGQIDHSSMPGDAVLWNGVRTGWWGFLFSQTRHKRAFLVTPTPLHRQSSRLASFLKPNRRLEANFSPAKQYSFGVSTNHRSYRLARLCFWPQQPHVSDTNLCSSSQG